MTIPHENSVPGPETLPEPAASIGETATFDSQVESDRDFDTTQICGRYVLERLLGSGGFGEVWKGTDPSLDRPVAVKRLRADRLISSEAVAAFLEEGRKLANLHHSGIVSVFDAGMSGSQPYIVSELVFGGSLNALLNREVISARETCRIIRELAETLHYLHAQGIVHRDIKPQNILMEQGRPKLADFGLAISEFEQLSERPSVVGTYSYMSPEQVRGDSHLVDGRSDIYSLGVVLYQMLTGRMPFLGDSQQQLRDQILQREPRPLRSINDQIPPELEDICLKCLQKSISARYRTALDLARDLKKYEDAVEVAKPRRRMVFLAGLGAFVLLAGAVYAVVDPGEGELPRLPEQLPGQPEPDPKPASPAKNLLGDLTLKSITEYAVDPSGRRLNVTTFSRSLVSLGRTDDDLELEVTFSQPHWTGNIGIFFGYRPADNGKDTQYHALYLFDVEGVFYLRSSVFRFLTPEGSHTDYMLPQWKIDNFEHAQNTIGIHIQEGKLAHLAFNGQSLDEGLLAKIQKSLKPHQVDCRGEYGLFNLKSAGQFLAPMIDDEEVLYQIDK